MTDQSDQRRAIVASLPKDAQLTGRSDATRVAVAFEAGLLCLEQAAMPPNLWKASFAHPHRGIKPQGGNSVIMPGPDVKSPSLLKQKRGFE